MVDVYMKRSAKIYMVLLVWIAAVLQFFINEKMDIEEVFAGVQEADAQMQIDADVSPWGVYQVAHSHLTPTAIKNLLLNTEKELAYRYILSFEGLLLSMYKEN